MRKIAVLGVAALSMTLVAGAPATAAHGRKTFRAAGRVLVPTAGFPIVFGVVNACDPGSPLQGVGGYSIELPDESVGHEYTLTSNADVDVVFLSGPRGASCRGLEYQAGEPPEQKGVVPESADWAFVVLMTGADAEFEFKVERLRSLEINSPDKG